MIQTGQRHLCTKVLYQELKEVFKKEGGEREKYKKKLIKLLLKKYALCVKGQD